MTKVNRMSTTTVLIICVLIGITFLPADAMASTGGGGLPWESPLTTLKTSLTGPVAFVISILGIVGCGGVLIFGGQINDFIRTTIFIVLVAGLLVAANNVLSGLGYGSGAVVGTVTTGGDKDGITQSADSPGGQ
jgi:type IV secretion system protein TrbC